MGQSSETLGQWNQRDSKKDLAATEEEKLV